MPLVETLCPYIPPVLSYIRSVQILRIIVPVLVGPLAGHANSLSAPLQRPIRSVQILRIYDAPSLPRNDNRFDQELPSIRGSKVWRKESRPVACWILARVRMTVRDAAESAWRPRLRRCAGATPARVAAGFRAASASQHPLNRYYFPAYLLV
jgi:hypothetical protein